MVLETTPLVDLNRMSSTHTIIKLLSKKESFLEGTIDKKSIGSGMGGIIHTSWLDCGHEETSRFMNQVQQITNYWVLQSSFSIGVSDTVADLETMEQIENTINKAKAQVLDLVRQGQRGELETQPGRTMVESFEQYVNKVLNTARDHAGKSAQSSLDETNSVKAMVTAGSKGSFLNISQIIACVGQQNVEGKRIPYGFKGRTLPHFSKDDFGPESRGFVENSYLRGLTPQEFFFHAMGGREGLIDTAVKTAETRYIQRRLVKSMEDVIVKYDGTVRNALGEVLQFLYGEDGMDAVALEHGKISHIGIPVKRLESQHQHHFEDPNYGREGNGKRWLEQTEAEALRRDAEAKEGLRQEYEQLLEDRRVLTDPRLGPFASKKAEPPVPVNLTRLIGNAKKTFNVNMNAASTLKPLDIVNKVKGLLAELEVVKVVGNDTLP